MPTKKPVRPDIGVWGQVRIEPGQAAETQITISESYSGMVLEVPVYVRRAPKPGPTVFVTGAVHGDEINGTGAIRNLIANPGFELATGALILIPVVNLIGFERHSRYLPDRRDLNRSFPGSTTGSLAGRQARAIMDAVVARSDFGIDLHTAAVRRTNFPNVRADTSDRRLSAFARAFGAELIVNSKGPRGSLRVAAMRRGCRTLVLEAGEVWKVEPTVVEYTLRGVRNCLVHLGMVEGDVEKPPYQMETDATKWIRARHGGFLRFHVAPGDIVERGDPIATNTTLFGEERSIISSPRGGVVLGMTTIPSVAPGDPICHLAFPKRGGLRRVERAQQNLPDESLYERTRDDLASGMLVRDAD
ncbi:MAG: succinate dehydrogenase [Acidobacteria bacterium]|nr:succinate dehydrogenase [Acidobacteriota bacterium]